MTLKSFSSSGDIKTVVIMLHGWTGDVNSMLPISKALNLKHIKWVFPQAPFNVTKDGYSWFNKKNHNHSHLNLSFELLINLINDLNKEGFSNSSIYILGFSQGACLAMEFIIRQTFSIGGIIPVAGFIQYKKKFIESSLYESKETRVLLLHGKRDKVVLPYNSTIAQELFINAGYKSKLYFFNSRHKFPIEAKGLIKQFIVDG